MLEPPRSRARTADAACVTGLLVNAVAPFVLAAATPALLAHHVLLLEALSTSAVAIVTGGALASVGRISLLLVLAAPLCGIVLTDVFFWWAGRRWGERIVAAYTARRPRSRAWVERADRWVSRHGVGTVAVAYFLPVPNPALYLTCGAAGMRLPVFVLGDVIGTLLWTGLLASLGWSLGQSAVDVVNSLNHDELAITLVVVAVLVLLAYRRRRRGAGPA